MKTLELLSLSVITATLIVSTGCSSDDDGDGSGASAPSEITKGVELNTSVTNNAMALLGSAMNELPDLAPARMASRLAALQVTRSSNSDNSTRTYQCDISGSYTNTSYTKTTGDRDDKPKESWSYEHHWSVTYDDCVDNYSGVNYVGDTLDQSIRDGVLDGSEYSEYNSDTNRSKDNYSSNRSYSIIYRSSSTEATITNVYDDNMSWQAEAEGTDLYGDNVDFTGHFTLNGTKEMYHTNTSGDKVAGIGTREVSGGFSISSERVYTPAKATSTLAMNGFTTQYETNSTGEHVIEGEYYDNYKVTAVKVGDEQTTTMSGTLGSTCLGGSVTVSVDPIIKENDVTYHDQLPYDGKATLKGSNTSTVTFSVRSDDNTKTQATVQVDDGPLTQFNDWNTLATGKCQDD